jgi:hypothetical protein
MGQFRDSGTEFDSGINGLIPKQVSSPGRTPISRTALKLRTQKSLMPRKTSHLQLLWIFRLMLQDSDLWNSSIIENVVEYQIHEVVL